MFAVWFVPSWMLVTQQEIRKILTEHESYRLLRESTWVFTSMHSPVQNRKAQMWKSCFLVSDRMLQQKAFHELSYTHWVTKNTCKDVCVYAQYALPSILDFDKRNHSYSVFFLPNLLSLLSMAELIKPVSLSETDLYSHFCSTSTFGLLATQNWNVHQSNNFWSKNTRTFWTFSSTRWNKVEIN